MEMLTVATLVNGSLRLVEQLPAPIDPEMPDEASILLASMVDKANRNAVSSGYTDFLVLAVDEAELAALRAAVPITVQQVKDEAGRRIMARYPEYKQRNLGRQPDSDEAQTMFAFIDAIRATAHELEAMDPIPADYAADKWWTLEVAGFGLEDGQNVEIG